MISETGICVWLDADAETLAARIQSDQSTAQRRPSLTSKGLIEEIGPLLEQRRPLYEAAATFRIDTTGKSIDQVAIEALAKLP